MDSVWMRLNPRYRVSQVFRQLRLSRCGIELFDPRVGLLPGLSEHGALHARPATVNSVIREPTPDVWNLGLKHRYIAAPSGYGQRLRFAERLAKNGERGSLR